MLPVGQPADDVQGEALVDEHGRVAQREVADRRVEHAKSLDQQLRPDRHAADDLVPQQVTAGGVDATVHIYAEEGPDLADYLQKIDGYNARTEYPTAWRTVTIIEPPLRAGKAWS